LVAVSAGGVHYLWRPKRKWSPPLGASVELKIDKKGLEARKLWPPPPPSPQVGEVVFAENFHLKNILKYYSLSLVLQDDL
jgi:hypothetical protein